MFRMHFIVIGLGLVFPATLLAQEEPTPGDANSQHLEELIKRVSRLAMRFSTAAGQAQPVLRQPPVMRSPNKGENHDGAVWLWLDGKQPVAVLSHWNRGPVWYSENTTLSEEALEVTGWPEAKWTAPGQPRRWIAQDEPVPDLVAARQRVLREISRKFTAREDRLGIKSELRLWPRPIYTYDDPEHGLIEGALLAFVLGTDPELFLQIEARTSGNTQQWRVAFSRMASAELSVKVADQEIWRVEAVPIEYKTRHDVGYCMVREPSANK